MIKCRVGTRSSELALWQTNYVIEALKQYYPKVDFELVKMSTKGDRILDQSLSAIGDKGLFTQELEVAMLEGKIDFAVHSLKDMATKMPPILGITAMLKREDPRDALLSKNNCDLADLPKNAVVGTSSLRRKALLLKYRPDLNVIDLRGNVQTRLKKYRNQNFDAAILACAGLDRMGLSHEIYKRLDLDSFVPAVGQGIICVESKTDNLELIEMLSRIHDVDTAYCAMAERSFLSSVEGGCQIPVGAYAILDNISMSLTLHAFIASLDGNITIEKSITGSVYEASSLGEKLAEIISNEGGLEILDEIKNRRKI